MVKRTYVVFLHKSEILFKLELICIVVGKTLLSALFKKFIFQSYNITKYSGLLFFLNAFFYQKQTDLSTLFAAFCK